MRLQIFSNEDILRTVAGAAIGYVGYMPALVIEIKRGTAVERVFGSLEWNGKKPRFNEVLKKFFDSDDFDYFMLRHFGGQKQINADLMDELGLSYAIIRLDEDKPIAVRVRPSSIDDVQDQSRKSLDAFFTANKAFVNQVLDFFLKHELEFQRLFEDKALSFFEIRLEPFKQKSDGNEPTYWSGAIESCDTCKRDLTKARFMIDSAVTVGGPWGCMCAVCFYEAGGSIGWGKGQLYEREERGWRLVGGGPPGDDGHSDEKSS